MYIYGNGHCPECGLVWSESQLNDGPLPIECPRCDCDLCTFEPVDGTEEELWFSGLEECRICGYKGAFVAPSQCDLDNMECANCHNMTCEETT